MRAVLLALGALVVVSCSKRTPVPEKATPGDSPMPVGVERVDLELDLPQRQFTGTPKKIVSEHLDPWPITKPPPALRVPLGAVNLAAGKAVSGSDDMPIIGEMVMLTDGDKEAGDGSYVEFGPGRQYVQVDLATSAQVHAIVVWHFHSQARVYRDVIVQLSDDPEFRNGVTTVFSNDHDNSSGLGLGKDYEYIDTHFGRRIDAKGTEARYVRLYSNGSTAGEMNHYIEIEVYGLL